MCVELSVVEWRICEGFLDYEVNESGDVRRATIATNTFPGRLRKPQPHEYGYPMHVLKSSVTGKPKSVRVHQLVAIAFLGPKPTAAHAVAHKDGNPLNPHVSNLRWATLSENQADRIRHGTTPMGEKSHLSKLSDACRLRIREARIFGAKYKDLASVYGIHSGHACWVAKKWKTHSEAMA